MIKCHLSVLMGKHKMKIVDVARATKLNRSTITSLYNESAERVDLDSIDKLCKLFECELSDLFEFVDDKKESN